MTDDSSDDATEDCGNKDKDDSGPTIFFGPPVVGGTGGLQCEDSDADGEVTNVSAYVEALGAVTVSPGDRHGLYGELSGMSLMATFLCNRGEM